MWFDELKLPHSKCEGCIAGKSKRRTYKSSASGSKATKPIERIHSDLMGPMDPKSVVGGFEYAWVFTCDHSRHVWVYLMREKSHTFRVFKKVKALAENLTGHKMKFFCSDRGGEFMSHEFTEFLE